MPGLVHRAEANTKSQLGNDLTPNGRTLSAGPRRIEVAQTLGQGLYLVVVEAWTGPLVTAIRLLRGSEHT